MKQISDKKLVEFLWNRIMVKSGKDKKYLSSYSSRYIWDPLNNMGHAWEMHGPLRDAEVHEYPLFLCLSDDGGIYYRARVHHQYDFSLVSDYVDYKSACRAICMTVYKAMNILDNNEPWMDHSYSWNMIHKPETPKIGLGVFLVRDGKFLLGKRKGSHGSGKWGLPGGHMELGEDFTEGCAREVMEETGIKIKGIKKLGFHNHQFKDEGLHYVTLFFEALWDNTQEPQNKEPNKTTEWKWFSPDKLDVNLLLPELTEFLSGCNI